MRNEILEILEKIIADLMGVMEASQGLDLSDISKYKKGERRKEIPGEDLGHGGNENLRRK